MIMINTDNYKHSEITLLLSSKNKIATDSQIKLMNMKLNTKSKCPLGLLVNFGENSLVTKRIIL